jgi:hypothetical protein
MFAPLSPTSSHRLGRIHAAKAQSSPEPSLALLPSTPTDDSVYDDPSHRHHSGRRHRSRRDSAPSSDRPNKPSKHRRRNRNLSRRPSPASSSESIEDLPPRFDQHGRALEGSRGVGGSGGSGGQGEMVEKIVHSFSAALDGQKTWKALLSGLVQGATALKTGNEPRFYRDDRRRRRE